MLNTVFTEKITVPNIWVIIEFALSKIAIMCTSTCSRKILNNETAATSPIILYRQKNPGISNLYSLQYLSYLCVVLKLFKIRVSIVEDKNVLP